MVSCDHTFAEIDEFCKFMALIEDELQGKFSLCDGALVTYHGRGCGLLPSQLAFRYKCEVIHLIPLNLSYHRSIFANVRNKACQGYEESEWCD